MILVNLAGVILFILSLIVMFAFVPRNRIKHFLWVGLIGGFGVALVLVYLMQNLSGYWIFYKVDFLYAFSIPLFLSAAWAPIIISFGYYLSHADDFLDSLAPLMLIPLGAVIVHYLLIKNEMLVYHHWHYSLTFLTSLGILLGITAYLYFSGKLSLKTNE